MCLLSYRHLQHSEHLPYCSLNSLRLLRCFQLMCIIRMLRIHFSPPTSLRVLYVLYTYYSYTGLHIHLQVCQHSSPPVIRKRWLNEHPSTEAVNLVFIFFKVKKIFNYLLHSYGSEKVFKKCFTILRQNQRSIPIMYFLAFTGTIKKNNLCKKRLCCKPCSSLPSRVGCNSS